MNFFWVNLPGKENIKYLLILGCSLFITSCATHHPQYGKDTNSSHLIDTLKFDTPAHRFFLIGDAGYAAQPNTQLLLSTVNKKLKQSGKKTTLLYLGDNIYPLGMPPEKNTKDRKVAEENMQSQMDLAKNVGGKTLFIPGNHDWYHGLEGLEAEEKFVEKELKKAFLPGKGCAIKDVKINDSITLITIDSQWYIEDWDNYPNINDDCNIKTREGLFTELEDVLNDNKDKTILLAIHHPLMSNGTHGGHFSVEKQLFPLKYKIPLPGLGSFINLARKASGYSTQDIQSRVYISLTKRVKALIQGMNNVIVVSGHDHNLQYIYKDNIHQIISGAGSKEEAARVVNPLDFSYGGTGYSILDIYNDGTARVQFFGFKDGKEVKLFEKKITELLPDVPLKNYTAQHPQTIKASVYTPDMTDKSGFYKFFFGKHYRKYYSMPIEVTVALIDTLHGGLTPDKAGGGHQSKSLRLVDKDGKEYVMRGIKKSALRFLQTVAFKNRNMGNAFEDTFAEDFLFDFYTTAHPYTPFVVASLAEEAGVYHTNPELYYIPKHNALKEFNEEFGDELYMVEERPADEHKNLESFGKPDAIEGTDDVLKNLKKDKKYSVDQRSYIRARLFDMLIGDWDRHTDQWRWARYDKDDKVIYRPIPKDRDQAFTKYDGVLVSILMNIPALRHMQTFKDDIRNVKWFNREPYPLDLALLTTANENDWIEEAKYIRENLSDDDIEKAFLNLPKEVQDETAEDIKKNLKIRKTHLEKYAREYRAVLLETVIITGTDKKDRFVINRLENDATEVVTYSVTDGAEKLIHTHLYNKNETKEIWIYGLDDDDVFEVKGTSSKPIILRLLGGLNHDVYNVENGKKVRVYDFKNKENTYNVHRKTRLMLTDDYETNTYDFEKPKYNIIAGYPSVGYNPDDGAKIGGIMNFTVNNFNRRPYSQKHSLKANYYFATYGFELLYRGTFMNVATKWNFAVDATYTSPNFSMNYFGTGNESKNYDDYVGMDYNRVKLQIFRVAPSFFSESRNGSHTEIQAVFETIEIDGTENRFVNLPGIARPDLFEHLQFGGINAKYSFENYDNVALPALGFYFYLSGGWKTNFESVKRSFAYGETTLGIIHKITPDDKLVISSYIKAKSLFNNNFEFYQAALLGGDNDLRGYRRERFNGRQSFLHSTDIRFSFGSVKTSFVPMTYGIFGGYDYGRVWVDSEDSNQWHQSVGGGLWLNGVDAVTAKLTYFHGTDGGRVAFGLGFAF
jgi:hypothetical protein